MDDDNVLHGGELPPVPQISIGEYFLTCLQQHGDKVFQVDALTGETQTFSQILTKSICAAQYMSGLGIRPGDVVAVTSENNLDFCIPVLAAFYNGIACATFSPFFSDGEVEHTLNISKPRIIFASALSINRVIKAAEKIDSVRYIVLIGRSSPELLPCNIKRLSDFFSPPQSSSEFLPAQVNHEEDTCLILHSSGTTGLPKGVELTHKNWLTHIHAGFLFSEEARTIKDSDNLINHFPCYSTSGFSVLTVSIVLGVRMIMFPRYEIDEELFLQTMQDNKTEILLVVPPLLVFLAKHPTVEKYDFSHVKTIICGTAPLSKDIQVAVSKRIGVSDIRQSYGLTETAVISTTHKGPPKLGASGSLVKGMMAKVVNVDTGNSLPRNKQGEICFKGPMVMKGYKNDKEATLRTIDKDGWLHTGDIGYFDDEGDIFIVDRMKELIKHNGFQVAPAELEAILFTNKAVRDACVIGQPHEKSGEVPVAFVELQPDMKITERELVEYVNGRVCELKHLRGGVRFVPKIPRNPHNRKPLRRELRSQL